MKSGAKGAILLSTMSREKDGLHSVRAAQVFCKLFVTHHQPDMDWWDGPYQLNPELELSGLKKKREKERKKKYSPCFPEVLHICTSVP